MKLVQHQTVEWIHIKLFIDHQKLEHRNKQRNEETKKKNQLIKTFILFFLINCFYELFLSIIFVKCFFFFFFFYHYIKDNKIDFVGITQSRKPSLLDIKCISSVPIQAIIILIIQNGGK